MENNEIITDSNNLGQSDTQVLSGATVVPDTASGTDVVVPEPTGATQPSPKKQRELPPFLRKLSRSTNIYLYLFVLAFAGVSTGAYLAYGSTQSSTDQTQGSTSLSSEQLQELRETDTQIGSNADTLTIDSNTVFNGGVLAKGSLDVAGNLNVGGSINLPGLTVSGVSNFDSLQISNELGVGGDSTVSGQLNVRRGLTVSGSGSFGGNLTAAQLNVERLQLSQDLIVNRHLVSGGAAPRISVGAASGGGGTASLSGSDIAGIININTGSGAGTGTLATISYASNFSTAPHISLTPASAAAAGVDFYVTTTTTGFTIFATSNAPSSTTLSFHYVIIN